MTDKRAIEAIIDHLLGKDYYIVDPVNNDQANDIVVQEIINRYKPMNRKDNVVLEYRKKHKKCSYCKYLNLVVLPTGDCSYFECRAKDRIIKFEDAPRPFCSCYTVGIDLIKGDV